ncbi:MAG: glutamate racemase [Candidatus Levybacteria bacterium RIFCSPHIGHO2_01_FULL_37_17]|nr:MAG: glutamate racemase [Candidatus Levybacteria bacterium RIFCSPHIGHO2_01_FULL_37_17]OGH36822.1 MAG: glutamate racemase [Candidatus Levybacteria bacterium RIFCSPLOWO2_01_FULL_38_23]
MTNLPIGVLDSGLGGLTVASEIIKLLPKEQIIYFGDSKNIPYSKKSKKRIFQLSKNIVEFLIKNKAKIIVIACNTITVSAINDLRKLFQDIPIVGTVPVIKTAVKATHNGRIGIFSTKKTAESIYQRNLIKEFAKSVKVLNLGSDEIVPKIEQGKSIKTILEKELLPFRKAGVDTLALGCTHYSLVKEDIRKIMGSNVKIIDSGAAVARQVRRVLEANNSQSKFSEPNEYYTTADTVQIKKVIKLLGLSGFVTRI